MYGGQIYRLALIEERGGVVIRGGGGWKRRGGWGWWWAAKKRKGLSKRLKRGKIGTRLKPEGIKGNRRTRSDGPY